MNGEEAKMTGKDGEWEGALPPDSLSSLCSCSMGSSYAGGENALEAGEVASLTGSSMH
jgi:hypothetical protein